MIDGKSVRQKLIGSDNERAVSPVIGVILMVAITVILAAVIAAFVLDMGSGMEDQAQAGVSVNGEPAHTQTVSAESMANADKIEIRASDGTTIDTLNSVGQSLEFSSGASGSDTASDHSGLSAGTYSVVALFEDGSGANNIAKFDLE